MKRILKYLLIPAALALGQACVVFETYTIHPQQVEPSKENKTTHVYHINHTDLKQCMGLTTSLTTYGQLICVANEAGDLNCE